VLAGELTNGLAAKHIRATFYTGQRAKRKVGDEAGDLFITGQGTTLVNAEKLADQLRAVKQYTI